MTPSPDDIAILHYAIQIFTRWLAARFLQFFLLVNINCHCDQRLVLPNSKKAKLSKVGIVQLSSVLPHKNNSSLLDPKPKTKTFSSNPIQILTLTYVYPHPLIASVKVSLPYNSAQLLNGFPYFKILGYFYPKGVFWGLVAVKQTLHTQLKLLCNSHSLQNI